MKSKEKFKSNPFFSQVVYNTSDEEVERIWLTLSTDEEKKLFLMNIGRFVNLSTNFYKKYFKEVTSLFKINLGEKELGIKPVWVQK